MKKNLLIVVFCLLSTSLMAQMGGKRVTVGLSVGPSIDWLGPKTEGYEGNGAKMGLRYGIPVDINFTEANNYYFSTGILFSHSGGKLKFTDYRPDQSVPEVADISRKYNSIYISIPTGVKLKAPNFGDFVVAGNFGFYHGFLLSSRYVDSYNGSRDSRKADFKRANFFKESLYVGLGVEYIIQDDFRASLYINYSYTLTNYFKNKTNNEYTGQKERGNLNCLEFIFGIQF